MRTIKILILLLSSYNLVAQSSNPFIFEGGWVARATVFYKHGARNLQGGTVIHNAPYTHTKGVDGTGLNLTIGYQISKQYDLSLRAGTTVRYDFYYWDYTNCSGCEKNTVYFDQTFFITKSFGEKIYVGAGATMFSIGKQFDYKNIDGNMATLSLDFTSLDLLIGIPVWKLYVEPKISYVDHGFPGNLKESATLFGTRIYYRFLPKKKRG